jgi:hypothetical protein
MLGLLWALYPYDIRVIVCRAGFGSCARGLCIGVRGGGQVIGGRQVRCRLSYDVASVGTF